MYRIVISLVGLLMMITTPAAAQPRLAGSAVPTELRAIYLEAARECRAGGGRFIADPDGFADAVELNGDGKPDWIMHRAELYCTSDGHSAWCGTAGCSVELYLSQGNRLRKVWDANTRGYAIVDLPNRKKGLLASGHHSACTSPGSTACVTVWVWNGRELLALGKPRWATQPEFALLVASEENEPTRFGARWQLINNPARGPVAALMGHPKLPLMAVSCYESAPALQVRLGNTDSGLAIPSPVTGKPLLIHIGGDDEEDGIRPVYKMLYLAPSTTPREFGIKLDPQQLALLGGKYEGHEMSLSTNEGATWFPAGWLPLGGSTSALKAVTTACATGKPAGTGTVAAAAQQPVPPLGIVPGYYVTEAESCSDPTTVFFYDGKRIGLMGGSKEESFVEPVGPAKRQGRQWFLANWEMLVEALAPTRIQREVQDVGSPERLCPADAIPARFRVGR
jgi:hypothetical protein